MPAMSKTQGKVVQMITTLDAEGVEYEVIDGNANDGDFGDAKCVWARHVEFGQSENNRAGGYAFVEAAREQERQAKKLAAKNLASVVEIINSPWFKVNE